MAKEDKRPRLYIFDNLNKNIDESKYINWDNLPNKSLHKEEVVSKNMSDYNIPKEKIVTESDSGMLLNKNSNCKSETQIINTKTDSKDVYILENKFIESEENRIKREKENLRLHEIVQKLKKQNSAQIKEKRHPKSQYNVCQII